MDEGVEAARRKKLEAAQQEAEGRKKEAQVREALRSMLTEGAYARLMNVKLVNAGLYAAAANQVFGLYKRAGRKITEDEVVSILKMVKGKGRETKITFK